MKLVVIGPNVIIGDGVSMTKTALFDGTHIKDHSWLNSTIIGWHSTVGRWTRLEGVTVLGDDVNIHVFRLTFRCILLMSYTLMVEVYSLTSLSV